MRIMQRLINSWTRCSFVFHLSYSDRFDADETSQRGYNIGTRLIEDFLARSSMNRCADFREVGEVVAKVRGKSLLVHYRH
jgi:hypothetical protein